jgi:aminoglycoside phosphotransferase (APT) family kinase protein
VPGGPLDRDDAGQREQLAAWLAGLHRMDWDGGQRPGASSWLDRDVVRNAWWDWEIVDKPPVLVAAYERVTAFLADPPPLAVGVVHGDVYRGNTRVDGGRVVGVVDWEEARLDWLASELANAAWELRDPDGFVAAYVAAGGPAEVEHLVELTLLRNVADVLYSLTSKARGEAYSPEYVEFLLTALA